MATEAVRDNDLRPSTSSRVLSGAPSRLRQAARLPASGQARESPDEEQHHAEREEHPAEEQGEAHLIKRSVNDLCDAHAVLVVDFDHLAASDDNVVVGDDVDRRADLAVELDDLADA